MMAHDNDLDVGEAFVVELLPALSGFEDRVGASQWSVGVACCGLRVDHEDHEPVAVLEPV